MTLKKVPYVELRELSVKITTVKSQICGVTSMDLAFYVLNWYKSAKFPC